MAAAMSWQFFGPLRDFSKPHITCGPSFSGEIFKVSKCKLVKCSEESTNCCSATSQGPIQMLALSKRTIQSAECKVLALTFQGIIKV
jgi:hypothetical protein